MAATIACSSTYGRPPTPRHHHDSPISSSHCGSNSATSARQPRSTLRQKPRHGRADELTPAQTWHWRSRTSAAPHSASSRRRSPTATNKPEVRSRAAIVDRHATKARSSWSAILVGAAPNGRMCGWYRLQQYYDRLKRFYTHWTTTIVVRWPDDQPHTRLAGATQFCVCPLTTWSHISTHIMQARSMSPIRCSGFIRPNVVTKMRRKRRLSAALTPLSAG